ncbi:MAG: (2Fe-2S)-binding protein, partial [Thermomicrobiaceae bacterium]|nr:(2Fe-2S)-binding protein [Thermomicrobiaceae bacterium]
MALVDSVDLVARQEELKPAEDALQRAVSAAFQKAGPLGLQVKDLLNGTWLGHPLHPAVTDIP